ncbi:MAG: MBOAT family protein [Desulfobacteraceae bacterium]|nr:MAG: MBOAT family protein [Desulfobacteraceae bacterium]
MLFNSFAFAIFFPTVLLLYWCLSHRRQNVLLLVSSYFFYGCWDWRFLSLIAISTLVDYGAGIKIHQEDNRGGLDAARRKKRWMVLSVCTNLGILGFFKYFNFFIDSFAALLPASFVSENSLYLNIILPVGISFYTFQTMSYTIDIYRGKMKPTTDLLDFAVYVAFFPQLVAGPIERAIRLIPQIQQKRQFDLIQFNEGLHLILLGLFKKVFVADNLAPFVDRIFSSPDPTGFEILFGGWAFAFQVYGDFSGYSDIARGCAKCLGFELMVNFNHPYVAVNPVERWQRWHISLSSWLRDYLYISMGGSRNGLVKTLRNLFATFLLGGLWHGAGWNFVLWGAWEGMLVVVHRVCQPVASKITVFRKILPGAVLRLVKMLFFFQMVCIGLIIFRSHSIAHMLELLQTLLALRFQVEMDLVYKLISYVAPLTLYEYAQYKLSMDEWPRIARIPAWIRTQAYAVMFYLIAFHGATAQSFIYFQF